MNKCSILLDSGAFSVWKRGAKIDLDKYIGYCKRHAHELDSYVNLDCIPGQNGKMDYSQTAVERSAAESYENLQIMKQAGLKPIALFHQGERFYWLDKMLQDGESYVGISPHFSANSNEIINWMDRCFSRITDRGGKPLVRTHGFGVTSNVLCVRYPWYSVDSTSWSVGGGYGSILVPRYENGEPNYERPPITLRISARKQDQSNGFDGLTPLEQEHVRKVVADVGITMAELRNTFLGRWKFNVHYYKGMASACKGNLFTNRVPSMVHRSFVDSGGYKPGPLRLYLATMLAQHHHNFFLNDHSILRRLLSYEFLKDVADDTLGVYLATGLPPDLKPVKPKKYSLNTLKSEVYRVRRSQAMIAKLARPNDEETRIN